MAYYKSNHTSSLLQYLNVILSCNFVSPPLPPTSLTILILDSAMWLALDIGMLQDFAKQGSEKLLTQFHLPFIPQSPPGKYAGLTC